MKTPRYAPLIQSLPATVPFVGPEQAERERVTPFAARLGANENGFGPVPAALEAMQSAVVDVWKYGDSTSFDLRSALAKENNCSIDNILVGEGIDGLLGVLVRLMVNKGDTVVTSAGAYPTFNYHVVGCGGELVTVPYVNDHEDPASLFAKAADVGAKLVYLANPDNPMGSWHTGTDIVAALDHLPVGCLLVLDEAYVECAPDGTAAPVDCDDPRVIRMRTFSKAYGMAGLRIGYALAHPDLIRAFDKIRNHFGVNRLAQSAALAAAQDHDGLALRLSEITAARDEIARIATANGLRPLPSACNFVTIDCGQDGDFARKALANLIKRDCFVRMPFVAPQDRCIRISCAPSAELKIFEKTLPDALAEARADDSR